MRRLGGCVALALVQMGVRSAKAQSFWTGTTSDWNTASNWSPNGVPNSTSAAVEFPSSLINTINISANVSAESILFQNFGSNDKLNSSTGVVLSGVQSITLGNGVSGIDSINLASNSAGNLLFPSTSNLTIDNIAPGSAQLTIGSTTTIGTSGTGGVVFEGTGATDLSGTLASTMSGGITLASGTLALDYSSNTGSKFGTGGLTLGGGTLRFVPNSTTVTQNISGGVAISGGGNNVVGSGSGTIVLAAKSILRSGGTVDFSPTSSGPNFSITTTTGNTNGLLGTGPAFATVNGGGSWAMNSSGTVAAVTSFGANTYSSGTNTDVSVNTSQSGITTNSLRFNSSSGSPTLTLSGTNTLQSGGILVTPNSIGGTIAGGTLEASSSGELLVHEYSNNPLTISSTIVSSIGLTKSGPGELILSGNLSGLAGVTNVNGGTLDEFTPGGNAFNVSGGALIVGSLSGSGSTMFTDPTGGYGLSIDGSSGTSTYSGSLSGSGSLNKSGGSMQIFTGSDQFTGDVLVSGGAIVFNSASSFTTLNVTGGLAQVSSGTLLISSSKDGPLYIHGSGAALNISGGAVMNTSTSSTVDTRIDAGGSITVTGIGSKLNGLGATQQVEVGNSSGAATLNVFSGASVSSAYELLVGGFASGTSGTMNISSSSSVSSPLTFIGFFPGSIGTAIVNGTLTASQDLELGGGSELGQSNGTAKVTVNAGGTINAGLTTFLSSSASLNISGGTVTTGALSSSSGSGAIALTDPTGGYALNINGSSGAKYYAGSISGTGSVNKTGASTQGLFGINTFTGGVNISGGTLELASGNSFTSLLIKTGGNLQLDSGATYPTTTPTTFDGGTLTAGSTFGQNTLTTNLNVTANGGSFQLPSSSTLMTVAGTINGPSGTLAVNGPGTLRLQPSNSSSNVLAVLQGLSGITQINAGTLTLIGNGNYPLLAFAEVDVINGAVLNANGSGGVPDAGVEFGGSIVVNGAGSKFHSGGSYTFVGSFSGGSLIATNHGAVLFNSLFAGESGGTGTLTVSTGGTMTGSFMLLGDTDPSTGIATIDGSGSAVTLTNELAIGNSGTGTGLLSITNSGSVSTPGILIDTNAATINISGGTLTTGSFVSTSTSPVIQLLGDPVGGYALNITNSSVFASTTYAGSITGPGSLNVSSGATQTLAGTDTFTGQTLITGGTLILSGSNKLGNMNITSGTVQVTGTLNVLGLQALKIGSTGTLDLTNNAADINISGGSLATVNNLAKLGFHNGTWDGAGGITSSTAAADTNHLTAIGVIQNNQSGIALYNASHQFLSTTPGTADILAAYTYYGDTNLDGKVDGSDYSRIDSAYLANQSQPSKLTGWFNGDFNYDGTINGSDYTLIDNAFNSQGTTLAAAIAGPNAVISDQIAETSAVPEPTLLGFVGIGTIGLLSRRRQGR